jgi:hypothetical protein
MLFSQRFYLSPTQAAKVIDEAKVKYKQYFCKNTKKTAFFSYQRRFTEKKRLFHADFCFSDCKEEEKTQTLPNINCRKKSD